MLSKRARLWLGIIAATSLLSLASSCGGGGNTNTEETPTTKPVPTKDAGKISGKISYAGTAPAPVKIQTDADPQCTKLSPNLLSEEWVVKDGKVANTFVYIKEGTLADGTKLSGYADAPSGEVLLDQNGCHYKPHVIGVVVNQNIKITNSDPTQHNIHFLATKVNGDWNQSQVNGAPPMMHKLAHAEVMAPVKCNQHPWMKSFVGVMKTKLFAVSGEDGSFTISGVPPGKYTVVAWHEGAGSNPGTEKTMEVTVAANGSATADFTFGASAELRGQPSSLPMVEAMAFPMLGKH